MPPAPPTLPFHSKHKLQFCNSCITSAIADDNTLCPAAVQSGPEFRTMSSKN